MIIQAEKSHHLPSASWREGSCMVGPVKVAVLLLSDLPVHDQSLLHPCPTHRTRLPTYLPLGWATLLISWVTIRPAWHQFPLWWARSPSPWEWGQPPCPASLSRTLLQTCRLPSPLNHWCLCCWLQAFSSVFRLGECRFIGPVGCRSTAVVWFQPEF